jgi:hypothetical protein
MKLYEIDRAILNCIDLETGEIIDTEQLDKLTMEREAKLENVACWIKELKAEAEALKAEKMAFAKRQQVAENKMESLKKYLAYALDGQAFKTVRASVTFRKSQAVEIADIYKLDENYLRYKEPEADKTAIKEAIKQGKTVAGATLVENTSVIIK